MLNVCQEVCDMVRAQQDIVSAALCQAAREAEMSLKECVPEGWRGWIGNLDDQVETRVLQNKNAGKLVGRSKVALALAAHLRELPEMMAASVVSDAPKALAARLAAAAGDASDFVGAYAVVNILMRKAKDFTGQPEALLEYIRERRSTLTKKGVTLPKALAAKFAALEKNLQK